MGLRQRGGTLMPSPAIATIRPSPCRRLITSAAAGRLLTRDWDLYDTHHVVYQSARLAPDTLKCGYDRAYREFSRWPSIVRASQSHGTLKHQVKHFFYAAGWKTFEPLWDAVIRARQLRVMTPLLEAVLSRVTRPARAEHPPDEAGLAPPTSIRPHYT